MPAESDIGTPNPKPPAPALLGKNGRKLWRALVEKYDFDPWELPIVESACRQRDDITLLEDHLREHGIHTKGSTGQVRLDQAVTEVRLARRSFARLLGELKLPTEEDAILGGTTKPMDSRGRRAQNAANSRWRNDRQHRRNRNLDLPGGDVFDGATS